MFFNSMNLDTTVVVAILGQDSASLVVVFLFRFPDWLWIFYSEHVAFDIHLGTFYSLVWPYCFFDVIHCFVCVSWASAVFHFRICIAFVKQCLIEETYSFPQNPAQIFSPEFGHSLDVKRQETANDKPTRIPWTERPPFLQDRWEIPSNENWQELLRSCPASAKWRGKARLLRAHGGDVLATVCASHCGPPCVWHSPR